MTTHRRTLTSTEMVAALAACGMAAAEIRRLKRRRSLDRAMHELRRPLQALLLSRPQAERELTSVSLALSALRELESVVDGEEKGAPIAGRRGWADLLHDAADRWQQAARLRGGRISVHCLVKDATPLSPTAALRLSQALDNLILNALSHGGPQITLSAGTGSSGIQLAVVDRGRPPPHVPPAHPGRHGHGLNVVAGIATRLGGTFRIGRSRGASRAVIQIPTVADLR